MCMGEGGGGACVHVCGVCRGGGRGRVCACVPPCVHVCVCMCASVCAPVCPIAREWCELRRHAQYLVRQSFVQQLPGLAPPPPHPLPAVQANRIEETRLVMESTLPRGTQPSADWLGARAGRGSLLVAAGCFHARAGAQAAPAREGLPAWLEKRTDFQKDKPFPNPGCLACRQLLSCVGSSQASQPLGSYHQSIR